MAKLPPARVHHVGARPLSGGGAWLPPHCRRLCCDCSWRRAVTARGAGQTKSLAPERRAVFWPQRACPHNWWGQLPGGASRQWRAHAGCSDAMPHGWWCNTGGARDQRSVRRTGNVGGWLVCVGCVNGIHCAPALLLCMLMSAVASLRCGSVLASHVEDVSRSVGPRPPDRAALAAALTAEQLEDMSRQARALADRVGAGVRPLLCVVVCALMRVHAGRWASSTVRRMFFFAGGGRAA